VPDDVTDAKLKDHIQNTCEVCALNVIVNRSTHSAVLELKSEDEKKQLLSDGYLKYKGVKVS
jgi:hypothetical protein